MTTENIRNYINSAVASGLDSEQILHISMIDFADLIKDTIYPSQGPGPNQLVFYGMNGRNYIIPHYALPSGIILTEAELPKYLHTVEFNNKFNDWLSE